MLYQNARVLSFLVLILFLVLVMTPAPAEANIITAGAKLGQKLWKPVASFFGIYTAEKVLDNAIEGGSDDGSDDGCYGSCSCSPAGSCHSGCDCTGSTPSDPQTYGDGAHNHYGSAGYYYNSGYSY
ncbi:MAG: hypothetical protein OXI24_03865 [Candidatus Poribacteria bacterium]|nr:hypothetical protein [Candidatus Poribacteria bacterium]